jgi:hypothetical protein
LLKWRSTDLTGGSQDLRSAGLLKVFDAFLFTCAKNTGRMGTWEYNFVSDHGVGVHAGGRVEEWFDAFEEGSSLVNQSC